MSHLYRYFVYKIQYLVIVIDPYSPHIPVSVGVVPGVGISLTLFHTRYFEEGFARGVVNMTHTHTTEISSMKNAVILKIRSKFAQCINF